MDIIVSRTGDSISSLARRWGISPQTLAGANQLSDCRRLPAGLGIVIPSASDRPGRSIEVAAYAKADIALGRLEGALPYISYLCPLSYRLDQAGGLIASDDRRILAESRSAAATALLTLSNLDEGGRFSAFAAHALFSDKAAQEALLEALINTAEERAYAGVHLNFQHLYQWDGDGYNGFLSLAEERLHRRGLMLSTALAPQGELGEGGRLCAAQDYEAHGILADRIVLLSYGWGFSAPQAASPADRVRWALSAALEKLPAGKLLMGLSCHGWLWRLPRKQGQSPQTISSAAAVALAAASGSEIAYDQRARAPYFSFADGAGQHSLVWFEDARSIRERLKLIEEYSLCGICLQNAGEVYRPVLELLQGEFSVDRL